jgi:prolyl-tRNA synthetase
MIIPIAQKKEGVLDKAYALKAALQHADIRVDIDDSPNQSPGWKFNEYEMKGMPLRIEIGPRDIKNNQMVVVRRDTLEKMTISLDQPAQSIAELLETMQKEMLERARASRDEKTYSIENYDDFKVKQKENPGFAKGMWCGCPECEAKIKEDTGATIRCIPFEQEDLGETCHFCGAPAKHMVYVARAY